MYTGENVGDSEDLLLSSGSFLHTQQVFPPVFLLCGVSLLTKDTLRVSYCSNSASCQPSLHTCKPLLPELSTITVSFLVLAFDMTPALLSVLR